MRRSALPLARSSTSPRSRVELFSSHPAPCGTGEFDPSRQWLQRDDSLWHAVLPERYTSADDQLSPRSSSAWLWAAASGRHQYEVTALQLFGIVPLEPGMNSPVDGTSLVGFRAIGAVVAPVPYRRLDPTDESIAEYGNVVEAVFEHMPILPAPPGAVFRSRSVISRWLELHYVALTDALGALEGTSVARLTIRLSEAPLSDETLKEWQALATESLRMLRGQATAISSQPEDGHAEQAPGVLARTSFLIPRDAWSAFESTVRAESARHPHLDYTVTGPWPPYDFVRMQFGS